MIFNLGDANCDLPTTGKAWEILLEHVKANAMQRDLYLGDLDDDDIIQEVRERNIPYENIYGEDATVGELFNDDDIIDHIIEAKIPVDAIYDEDDLRENAMVQKMLEDEREGLMDDGWGKVDEKDDEIGQLEETIAELKQEIAKLAKERDDYGECLNRIQSAILEDANLRKAFESRWNKRFPLEAEEAEEAEEEEEDEDEEDEEDEEDDEEDELNSAIDASGNALY